MEGEEFRTGSADSENGSDNSYVQVTKEEAQQLVHAPAAPRIPAVDDEEDIYGAEEGTPTHAQGEQVKHQSQQFLAGSTLIYIHLRVHEDKTPAEPSHVCSCINLYQGHSCRHNAQS